ncbi:metal ABC transporter solute-binding protein, Zn/Mn family [Periweissella fabalis]|uniref:Zinc ABC transporter solute-binding protein n=1 Tax=Periweissella fabalis TaxID=1070421 RepID=A0A7X6S1W7_9LACO|nr:zinc ABC transporter substrate-binding protein [Periweissella fabalis]MCM0599065.1 zinc ABC transporter substrate-binding protein [Periweissella fabalis]NKZ23345.1 zinc ABC transporter solute-binding protein [Periweissella fabalis]
MFRSKKSSWHLLAVGALAVTAAFTLAACSSNKSATSDNNHDIKVVATVDFYGEVAKAVLGNQGSVTSIINNPDVDPHDYEPTTKVAQQVAGANVLLSNGIGYDTWMDKLAKNNSKATNIHVGEDIVNKKNGDNPHLWYRLQTMPALANYLANKFAKMDPKKADYFKANAQKYVASLQPLNQLVAKLKAGSNGKGVDVSEPVFTYALDEMNYKVNNQSFADSVENGTDPAPKDVAAMEKDITDHKIDFFVQNTQASDKTVVQLVKLAHAHNVPVVNVTETMPAGKDYIQWMTSQFKQVEKIQAKSAK